MARPAQTHEEGEAMSERGSGSVYHPKYRDRKTREWRESTTRRISYSFRGKKWRESSHSTNKVKAKQLLHRRLGEISRGRLIGPLAEKVTFEELRRGVELDYQTNGRKSLKRVQVALKPLMEFFEGCRAVDIT